MNNVIPTFSLTLLGSLMSLTFSWSSQATTVKLRIIETTDIHANLMDYDYYQDRPSAKLGLTRDATLIKKARKQAKNSVLVDNGDLIQGSPMGDYMAARGLKPGERHPVFLAMDLLSYNAATVGNHEFNYGLPFLQETLNDAKFPYVTANVDDAHTGKPFFTPYVIQDQIVRDTQGHRHTLKIGYIGFVPPQITVWDKQNLTGKVVTRDIVDTAKHFIPKMKARGADIIIVLAHSGISAEPYVSGAENAAYYLTQIPNVDAIATGHAHDVFPGPDFANLAGADLKNGTINGVPVTMPGRWGSHIGIMDLTLEYQNNHWQRVSSHAFVEPIYDKQHNKPLTTEDRQMVKVLAKVHAATRHYVSQPIGRSNNAMYSFLALVQDDPTIQIVNMAQRDYVEQFIKSNPKLKHLPVLSAAAPFKAGGRKNDPSNYTEVEAGTLTYRNAADLYLYPNTLVTLQVSGKELREWLECAAGQFNQIDPHSTQPQSLINWDGFRTYNFDVIDGVHYQIDITQPPRYDGDCHLIHPQAHRITGLTYKGKSVTNIQTFLVASNNYRAYGNQFPGTGESHVAFASPDENRTILANYIAKESHAHGAVHPQADNNWSLAPIRSDVKLDIRFETAPSAEATEFIAAHQHYPMSLISKDSNGFALYRLELQH